MFGRLRAKRASRVKEPGAAGRTAIAGSGAQDPSSTPVRIESRALQNTRAVAPDAEILALVASRTDNAVILTDPAGLIVWVNDGFERITGYSIEQSLGRRPGELLQGHETDAQTVRRMADRLAQGCGFREEVLNYRKNGEPYWIALEVHPIRGEQGEVTHFMALQRDITDERYGKLKLSVQHEVTRLLVEASALEATLLACARAIAKTLTWTRPAVYRLEGRHLRLLEPVSTLQDELVIGQAAAGSAWQQNKPVFLSVSEPPVPRVDPTVVAFPLFQSKALWGVMQFEFSKGTALGGDLLPMCSFIGHECSVFIERSVSRQQLESARAAAEQASELKTQFVATVSHEIRTPLNAVVGMAELLAELPLGDRQREYLSVIQQSADQLLTVINDVLDLSSIESGSVRLGNADFAVRDLVDRVLQIVRGLPRASGLEIDTEIDPAVPQWLRGDEARLSQVLINLMSNAIKFTEHGSVSLSVSVQTPATASDPAQPLWIAFSVKDTGLGIPGSMQSQIFEPYVQVGGRMITPQKGTGLGLAICRQLAAMMQGELTLQSEVGAGANFTLNVPLMVGQSPGLASQDAIASDGQGLDILVAEDTPASQLVIRLMLERMGHRVTVVSDGLQAVETFRNQHFDLILMDVQMPEMDGYEAARAIRQLGPADVSVGAMEGHSVPIVGLSAFALASNQVAGLQSGMNAYLTKPVQSASLERIIAEVTNSPARRAGSV